MSKKRRCYNCKFSGKQFKIDKLTHLHCENDQKYPIEKLSKNELCTWDTLKVFNETCDYHKFKKQDFPKQQNKES